MELLQGEGRTTLATSGFPEDHSSLGELTNEQRLVPTSAESRHVRRLVADIKSATSMQQQTSEKL